MFPAMLIVICTILDLVSKQWARKRVFVPHEKTRKNAILSFAIALLGMACNIAIGKYLQIDLTILVSLATAGIMGNSLELFGRGHVTDWIVIRYSRTRRFWFNFADIFLYVGAIGAYVLIVLEILNQFF